MYLLTIGEQSRIFLYSCGFGFLLGLLFDFFEFLFIFAVGKKSVRIFLDVLYMIVCTFLMFLFSLALDNGSFKIYIYAAAAMGWFIYYFTVGVLTRRVQFAFAELVMAFFGKFKSGIYSLFCKIKKKSSKKLQKNEISSNLLLQDKDTLLYNDSNSEEVR